MAGFRSYARSQTQAYREYREGLRESLRDSRREHPLDERFRDFQFYAEGQAHDLLNTRELFGFPSDEELGRAYLRHARLYALEAACVVRDERARVS